MNSFNAVKCAHEIVWKELQCLRYVVYTCTISIRKASLLVHPQDLLY
jgi:hypothetical protein